MPSTLSFFPSHAEPPQPYEMTSKRLVQPHISMATYAGKDRYKRRSALHRRSFQLSSRSTAPSLATPQLPAEQHFLQLNVPVKCDHHNWSWQLYNQLWQASAQLVTGRLLKSSWQILCQNEGTDVQREWERQAWTSQP